MGGSLLIFATASAVREVLRSKDRWVLAHGRATTANITNVHWHCTQHREEVLLFDIRYRAGKRFIAETMAATVNDPQEFLISNTIPVVYAPDNVTLCRTAHAMQYDDWKYGDWKSPLPFSALLAFTIAMTFVTMRREADLLRFGQVVIGRVTSVNSKSASVYAKYSFDAEGECWNSSRQLMVPRSKAPASGDRILIFYRAGAPYRNAPLAGFTDVTLCDAQD